MTTNHGDFMRRYPHGVLTEQEGGVSNDAGNWQGAHHICRKHRVRETVCTDAVSEEDRTAFAAALNTVLVACTVCGSVIPARFSKTASNEAYDVCADCAEDLDGDTGDLASADPLGRNGDCS